MYHSKPYGLLYIHNAWALVLLVSDRMGNARAFGCGTSGQYNPTFFILWGLNEIVKFCAGLADIFVFKDEKKNCNYFLCSNLSFVFVFNKLGVQNSNSQWRRDQRFFTKNNQDFR